MKSVERFCEAPWKGIHIRPDGTVFPCCLSTYCLGSVLDDNSWDSIVSGELAQQLKQGFITKNPEIIKTCNSQCYAGKGIQNRYNEVVDGKLDLDIRISNSCNLACRMCSPWASSRWEKELGVKSKKLTQDQKKQLVSFVKERASAIQNLSLVGGEPTIIPEFYEILEYLVVKGYSKNIWLIINTNLQLCPDRFYALVSTFRKVTLCISIDAVGPVGEWIRTGSNWKLTDENVRKVKELSQIYPNIELCISPTISILNIFQLDDLHRYGREQEIHVTDHNILTDPVELCLGHLSVESKGKIEKYLQESLYIPSTWINYIITTMQSLQELPNFEKTSYEFIKTLGSGYFELAKEQDNLLNPKL